MCYHRFTLAMDRSPGFGSTALNYIALLRLAFAAAPSFLNLTLLNTVTRWPILQKVRSHTWEVRGETREVGFCDEIGCADFFPFLTSNFPLLTSQ